MSPVLRDFFYYCIIFVMIVENKKIELLAPAKNKECAIAAINAGADAVYIGADSFGARKKAGNSLSDIAEIVDYAHKFLVRVYVTVNTILFDNELKEVEKLIWELYEIGVDAIIFQDFAFFEMNLPPIALHASTQCNNDTIEKIKFLKSMNVERVVLPREFSIDEIKKVTKNIDIDTEVFIHGALCVSYSGQCYFSNYIGKRSANRGDCAQPCRKMYTVVDDKGNVVIDKGYLLSMKDNNLSAHIKELIDAGVTSLKIEGRLKDKEYVTNVVSHYRSLIDAISNDLSPSFGRLFTNFIPDVNKTFNRGYTDFYFDGKRKTFINPLTPKFIGEKAGKVKSVKGNTIVLEKGFKFNVSDKVAFFNDNFELTGTTVTKVLGNTSIEVLNSKEVKQGLVLYRNYDSSFYKSLNNAIFERKIPLKIYADNKQIVFKSFANNIVEYKIDEKFETANNIQKAKDNLIKQLAKLGESEFVADQITVSNDFNIFIPISKINDIRRNLVAKLQETSKNNYFYNKRDTDVTADLYPYKHLDYSFNISNNKAKSFYEKYGSIVVQYAPECAKYTHSIDLMKTKHCLRDYAGICLKKNPDKRKLYLVDTHGVKYPLNFDCKKCVMKIEIPVK